jgi:RimJ/RimL family protein N-acetyltransferase
MTAPWENAPTGRAAMLAGQVSALIPTRETERLTLRAPLMRDFNAFARLFADDSLGHLGGPLDRPAAFEVFLSICGSWMLRGHGLWSVDLRETGTHLGFVLLGFEPGDLEPELGWLFLQPYRGMGYATEAARAARDFARTGLGWDQVVSYVAPDNTASARLAQRLGAVLDDAMCDGCQVWRHDLTKELTHVDA